MATSLYLHISDTKPRRRWQVILPETGEIQELSENDFVETWVLESECPPAVRQRFFNGLESYASWRWGRK